jgi:hypothetical protein
MKPFSVLFGMVLVLAVAVVVVAGTNATADRGKQLFNDPSLGTNGKSCTTCHPSGKGIESSGKREDIARVINGCITGALKGKALDPSSEDMQSLVLYLKNLDANKHAPGREPHHGC